MGKYLPGYSYGQSGGPVSIAERNYRQSVESDGEFGTYAFDLYWRGKVVDRVRFKAGSIRAAQKRATELSEEICGWPGANTFVSFQKDE